MVPHLESLSLEECWILCDHFPVKHNNVVKTLSGILKEGQ